jgi:hypothetical protein
LNVTKYITKPLVIEAFKYDGDLIDRDGKYYVPKWAIEAHKDNDLFYIEGALIVCTLKGMITANVGDYIVKGIQGELYPCDPEIFEETYSAIQEIKPPKTLADVFFERNPTAEKDALGLPNCCAMNVGLIDKCPNTCTNCWNKSWKEDDE